MKAPKPDLDAVLRSLAGEPRGFGTDHVLLRHWTAHAIGYACKALVAEGVLRKSRGGRGRWVYVGAQFKHRTRSDNGVVGLYELVREHARRAGAAGFLSSGVDGAPALAVSRACSAMASRGELHRVALGGKGNARRYFADAQHAAAFVVPPLPVSVPAPRVPKYKAARVAAGEALPYGQMPALLDKAEVYGEPDFSRAMITTCPGYEPRFTALDVLCPLLARPVYRRAA